MDPGMFTHRARIIPIKRESYHKELKPWPLEPGPYPKNLIHDAVKNRSMKYEKL